MNFPQQWSHCQLISLCIFANCSISWVNRREADVMSSKLRHGGIVNKSPVTVFTDFFARRIQILSFFFLFVIAEFYGLVKSIAALKLVTRVQYCWVKNGDWVFKKDWDELLDSLLGNVENLRNIKGTVFLHFISH